MCTKEDINHIVSASEQRMESRLQASHGAIAKTISNLMSDMNERLNQLNKKADETVLDRGSIHILLANLQKTSTETLLQATKTNGRVNGLDTWRAVHTSESVTVSKSLDEVRSVLNRLNWLLIVAVIGAVLNLVIKSQ